jgi:hypothetical protein
MNGSPYSITESGGGQAPNQGLFKCHTLTTMLLRKPMKFYTKRPALCCRVSHGGLLEHRACFRHSAPWTIGVGRITYPQNKEDHCLI